MDDLHPVGGRHLPGTPGHTTFKFQRHERIWLLYSAGFVWWTDLWGLYVESGSQIYWRAVVASNASIVYLSARSASCSVYLVTVHILYLACLATCHPLLWARALRLLDAGTAVHAQSDDLFMHAIYWTICPGEHFASASAKPETEARGRDGEREREKVRR